MNAEDLRVNAFKAAGITVAAVGYAIGVYAWAEGKHEDIRTLITKQEKVAAEERKQTALLAQLVKQQAEAVKEAAKDAKQNRESLIRIEAKLQND